MVLQTETGKPEALSHLQNNSPSPLLKKGSAILEAQLANKSKVMPSSPYPSPSWYPTCVALRFEMGYAIGAVVATIHDILMTVGLFVLIGHLSDGMICRSVYCPHASFYPNDCWIFHQ